MFYFKSFWLFFFFIPLLFHELFFFVISEKTETKAKQHERDTERNKMTDVLYKIYQNAYKHTAM